ncbi:MAG: hypothetical protein IID50_03500 [Proteobacteria bacterium]|nr:hypothetical protein [Pseudomonadota bacterium]
MAKRPKLPSPMVRRRAGLHADQARWQLLEKGNHLAASQALADHDGAGIANAVDLKNVFREIKTDCDNFVHGRLLLPRGL